MRYVAKALIFAVLLGWAGSSLAADDSERTQVEEDLKNYGFKTVTTPEGLHFNVPDDMPIQKKDGLVAPLPFDEYLYYKFRKMDEKLSEMGKKIDKLQESVDSLTKKIGAMSAAQEKTLASANT